MPYLLVEAFRPIGIVSYDVEYFFIPITPERQWRIADAVDNFIFQRRMMPWDPPAGSVFDTTLSVAGPDMYLGEYNGQWTVYGASEPYLDIQLQEEAPEPPIVTPNDHDTALLQENLLEAKLQIYAGPEYDPEDGDKGILLRWDILPNAPGNPIWLQSYHDWTLTSYWELTGLPPQQPRYFQRNR